MNVISDIQIILNQIHAAAQVGTALRIRGGGSKDFYGQMLQGEILDMSGYRGIVQYDPTELVISARAGTPLKEIETALAAHHQFLAFEPPCFNNATIGGVVAAGLAGPRRVSAGALRDFVLGARLIDGRGQHLCFGGTVMKNVAGYDISRLLAGSLGVLGVITEVSLKVLPRPFEEVTLALQMDEAAAIIALNQWGGQPLPISASLWHDNVLSVRLSGAPVAIDAACSRIGGVMLNPGAASQLWETMREQTHTFFHLPQPEHTLMRLSVPATTPVLKLPGQTLLEWGGAQRWVIAQDVTDIQLAQAVAVKAGGYATRFRGTAGQFMTPLHPVTARIHRQLKQEFDPHHLFNRGRMFANL